MRVLKSYILGRWHEPRSAFVPLVDPCSEEVIAQASSHGIDFAAVLAHARQKGRARLRELTIGQRGALLVEMSQALGDRRDELIALSLRNTGTTRKDAKFDVDGAIFTLQHYGELGRELGERRSFLDGEGIQLSRSARFWGQHVLLPLDGVALHINAFNFPAWGFAEKAAAALLAGMPVVTKPATSSAWVAERCMELVIERGTLPDGALSMICGSAGDLLDHVGPQDVVAFTGSATTARGLRAGRQVLETGARMNVEADSLNAAVLGPDVTEGSESWGAFLRDVVREMTQKTGQKCTAVRRILVPRERLAAVEGALVADLARVVVGNPEDATVTMGPLATSGQLAEAIAGVAQLRRDARVVAGTGERIDGVGNPPGKGFFLGPVLLRAEEASGGGVVHRHEVFGPVATLLGYDGSAVEAAEAVGLGGGSLVTSVYSDDRDFLAEYLAHGGATSGRLYLGSEKVASQLPGSGVAMPQLLHGGPGRAGGGQELGGLRGVELYLQRVALSGDRAILEHLAGLRGE